MNLICGYTYLQLKKPQYYNSSCFESKFMVLGIEMYSLIWIFVSATSSPQSEIICHTPR